MKTKGKRKEKRGKKKLKHPSLILILFSSIHFLFQECLAKCGTDKGDIYKVLKVFQNYFQIAVRDVSI